MSNSQRGFIKRRGKSWTAYWYVETLDGRKQRTKGGFATKKDAQAYLTDAMSAMKAGSFAEPVKVRFGDYLVEQWLPTREISLRPSTYSSYVIIINKQVLPELGAIRIQQPTANDIDRFYAKLSKSGLKPKTVRNVHIIIHKALHDAVRKSLIPKNPADAADPPRVRKSDQAQLSVWTPEQLRTFFDGIAKHRLAAAYILAATTGMRRGEVLGLRWCDVDFADRSLTITQTVVSVEYELHIHGPKTAGSQRRVALDDRTIAVLEVHRERQLAEREQSGLPLGDEDLAFARIDATPIHPDYFSQTFDRTVARLQLSKIRLHDLRHTYATLALSSGIPAKLISDRLGHATSSFTADVYVRSVDAAERAAAALMAERIFGER